MSRRKAILLNLLIPCKPYYMQRGGICLGRRLILGNIFKEIAVDAQKILTQGHAARFFQKLIARFEQFIISYSAMLFKISCKQFGAQRKAFAFCVNSEYGYGFIIRHAAVFNPVFALKRLYRLAGCKIVASVYFSRINPLFLQPALNCRNLFAAAAQAECLRRGRRRRAY